MRLFVFLLSTWFSLYAVASEVDKKTSLALEYISQGFVQYGFEELKKLAGTNGIAAQYYVAVCYEYGIGVEKNSTEAFRMYRKAAERGLPDAMFHIASFYREGVVVSQDETREKEWLQRYQQKGGSLTLPDILEIYNEGLKHPECYAFNPNDDNGSSQVKNKWQSKIYLKFQEIHIQPIYIIYIYIYI